jgi:hypothetical protein
MVKVGILYLEIDCSRLKASSQYVRNLRLAGIWFLLLGLLACSDGKGGQCESCGDATPTSIGTCDEGLTCSSFCGGGRCEQLCHEPGTTMCTFSFSTSIPARFFAIELTCPMQGTLVVQSVQGVPNGLDDHAFARLLPNQRTGEAPSPFGDFERNALGHLLMGRPNP